jgi:hypothetical protein
MQAFWQGRTHDPPAEGKQLGVSVTDMAEAALRDAPDEALPAPQGRDGRGLERLYGTWRISSLMPSGSLKNPA